MSLDELFCDVDDFCLAAEKWVAQQALPQPAKKRGPQSKLFLSEVMTIIIWFHMSHYRSFKHYYNSEVRKHLRPEFPGLVSYTRFVELMPATLPFLCLYMCFRMGNCTGISFIDSTRLPVCHNKRIQRNKVFKGLAARGKSSMGWFYGFKLHLVVNEYGEILSFCLTPGNVDDRNPVPQLAQELFGKLFGDKGYLSQQLFEQLYAQDVQLITPIRKNMKNKLLPLEDKVLSRKRSIIETINDQLKNISQILHTRHRSVTNFAVNLIAGLIAYTHQEKKPSLNLSEKERSTLPAII